MSGSNNLILLVMADYLQTETEPPFDTKKPSRTLDGKLIKTSDRGR